ncbi:hypothetical protein TRICI_004364 [Trichomonascus ciferrii]|uniref:Zn(2)-C6 fungal-type domain-containing protein n=1 Tax=Trichomonascus ciferrii TaxID=44093 RepID=A0A642V163_9ASCO|nr:hypothetical protein TRICI_004364 [Trichomonascus ciferrii]
MTDATESGSQRKLPACERCRSRKQKCDSALPSCSNCSKAGVECVNHDRALGRTVSRSYLWSLEEKLKNYEQSSERSDCGQSPNKRLRPNTSDSNSVTEKTPPVQQVNRPSQSSQERLSPKSPAIVPAPSSPKQSDIPRNTPSPVSSESHEDPMTTVLAAALAGTDGPHVSDDINRQIQNYSTSFPQQGAREKFIEKEKMAISKLGQDFLKQCRKNTTKNRNADISAYDEPLLNRLARRYFTWINSAYPVLHECTFLTQLEACRTAPREATMLDQFQVKMVISISLASISRPHLSTSEIGRAAHDFWKSATKTLSKVLCGRGIQGLQNILLLLQYTLLVPKGGNLWQLSGSAMRFATDLGLYAEPNPGQDFDPLVLDLRRRLFWTCYCIDRVVTTAMGRPTGIPEAWITVELPSLVEDRLITVNGVFPGPTCQLKVAQVHQVRICRLQAEIHGMLYAPSAGSMGQSLSAWSWNVYDQLRLWRVSLSYPTPLITKEWMELQYHIAVVLLFRPSPNRPNPSEESLHVAFHSAGEVMKLVKTMHRDNSAVFSWLTVQNLFMCGLTFINSLKSLVEGQISQKLCIPLVEVFLQIQACSAMLETLSTLEVGSNERIRNVFEMASSNVLHSLSHVTRTSIQQINHSHDCIWAQIAMSDNLNIQRPTLVDGINVPICMRSCILQQINIESWENSGNHSLGSTDEHFYEHDVDAASTLYINYSSIDPKSYITLTKSSDPITSHRSSSHSVQEQDSASTQTVQTTGPPTTNVHEPHSAQVRHLSDLPDWSETKLGAELEKWFLYPFSDASPSIPEFVSEQFM